MESFCNLEPKTDGTYPMCTDLRVGNSSSKTDSLPMSKMNDYIDKTGNAKCITKFNHPKGFI